MESGKSSEKSHMDLIGTVMLSIRICYQLCTQVKFRVNGKYLFQGCVSNKHRDYVLRLTGLATKIGVQRNSLDSISKIVRVAAYVLGGHGFGEWMCGLA